MQLAGGSQLNADTNVCQSQHQLKQLAAKLEEKLEKARAAWPGLDIATADFVDYLAQRIQVSSPQSLNEFDIDGLYLAFACSIGNPRAQRHLYQTYQPRVEAALGRLQDVVSLDDVIQITFDRLLRSTPTRCMAITKFGGRSTLDKWLVAVAFRQGYRALQRRGKVARGQVEEDLCDVIVEASDPELRMLKSNYRAHFKEAFHEAFAMLEPQERNIFRFQYMDRLNLEQFGALMGVSRATAARRRTRARQRLCELTRQLLGQRLALSPDELDSMMVMIESQLDISLCRLLAWPTEASGMMRSL